MDAWVYRLKAAYEAGYYQTEPAVRDQSPFPWHNKTCKDCPFWANSVCQVHAEYRAAYAHTCTYFDASNRSAARRILRERQMQGVQRWWEWLKRPR